MGYEEEPKPRTIASVASASTKKVICIPREQQQHQHFPQRMRPPRLRPHSYSDDDERHHHHHSRLVQQIWRRALLFEEVQPHLSKTIVSVVSASTTKAIFIRHRNRK